MNTDEHRSVSSVFIGGRILCGLWRRKSLPVCKGFLACSLKAELQTLMGGGLLEIRIRSGQDVYAAVSFYLVCKNRRALLIISLLALALACSAACGFADPESPPSPAEGLSRAPSEPHDSSSLEKDSATISEDGVSPRSVFEFAALTEIPESPGPAKCGSLSGARRELPFSRLRDPRIPARSPPLLSSL